MQWVTCEKGVLHVTRRSAVANRFAAVEALQPRAVHELLFDAKPHPTPMWPALAWARGVADRAGHKAVIWCDTDGSLYPPAVWGADVDRDRFYVLRVKPADVFWAVAECLRCRGAAAVVATVPTRMTTTQARRLQLAAEEGGTAGILLRPRGKGDGIYAAATRWAVCPAAGDAVTQRWTATLLHGQGGLVGREFLLESSRVNTARFGVTLVHRNSPAPTGRSPGGGGGSGRRGRVARRWSSPPWPGGGRGCSSPTRWDRPSRPASGRACRWPRRGRCARI